MSEIPGASDWAAARGEKWRDHLTGMEGMLAPVSEPLLGALRLDAPYRIADIGCGGGGTTVEILRRMPAGSVVHGFDISPALVERARGRVGDGDEGIAFNVADMGTAGPEAPYDRIVSRFGVMFFAEPATAFGNIARWVAPGGRFAFAVWGRPAENRWMSSLREAAGAFVEVPTPDPEAPGPFRYAEVGKLLELLSAAGFGALQVEDWRGTLPVGGGLPAAEAAAFALAAYGSFGELLAEAGEPAVRGAREALAAEFAKFEEGGSVRMAAAVHIVTGERPATASR